MLLYAITILLSAFLLFQVQPIIAKIILPWFGGSAAVWTTCLLFFQLARGGTHRSPRISSDLQYRHFQLAHPFGKLRRELRPIWGILIDNR